MPENVVERPGVNMVIWKEWTERRGNTKKDDRQGSRRARRGGRTRT